MFFAPTQRIFDPHSLSRYLLARACDADISQRKGDLP